MKVTECIQKIDMRIDIQQRLMLVLTVKVNEHIAHLFQKRQRDRSTVDKGFASAIHPHLPAQRKTFIFYFDFGGAAQAYQWRFGIAGEETLNGRHVTPRSDGLNSGSFA
jgi:hypothetical protein